MFTRFASRTAVPAAARAFSTTSVCLKGQSAYAAFLVQAFKKGSPLRAKLMAVKGGSSRAKACGKAYNKLSTTERVNLAVAAKAMKIKKHKKRYAPKKGNQWNKFVKANWTKGANKSLPFARRVKAIAKAYSA